MEPFLIVKAIEEIKQGNLSDDNFKTLFKACTQGENSQKFICEHFPTDFYQQHIQTGDKFITKALSICNNLCVMNPINQEKLLPIVLPLLPKVTWDENTGKYALQFLLACAQPGNDNRSKITVDLLLPFFEVYRTADHELNEDFYFGLINLMTACPVEFLKYGLDNPDTLYDITDLLHDACEQFADNIENHEELIQFIFDKIRVKQISPPQAKSNLIGVFAALVGASENAKNKALDMNAVDILKTINKIDINDPALLEWSVAALRFLVQFVDPVDKPNIYKPSEENIFNADDFM